MTTGSRSAGVATPPNGIAGSRLASLAVLQANFDRDGRSYIDSFVPFATQALADLERPATIGEIQAAIARRFGLSLPHAAVQTILGRATSQGVRRSNKRYVLTEPSTFDHTQGRNFLRCHTALCSGLREHAHGLGVELTDEDADRVLSAFVDDHVSALVMATAGQAVELVHENSSEEEFVVASYIETIEATSPKDFDYLMVLVKGSMLASAVYLPSPGSMDRRFRNTTMYLDTPFLLRLLGYAGPELEQPAREVVTLAKSHGAEVACFDHTVTEIRGVLTGVAAGLRRRGRSRPQLSDVERWLAQTGKTSSDVERFAVSLEKTLQAAGVGIKPAPARRSSLDEGAARGILSAEVRYYRDETLEHDLRSIASVSALRGSGGVNFLEDVRAIFVTTNDALSKAARLISPSVDRRYEWPTVILEHTLATLLWLKQPQRAPDLPRKQLIADCFAALRPDGQLWAQYVEKVRALADQGEITEDEVVMLRYSLDAQKALVDQTRGNPAAVSNEAILRVLERTRQLAQAPVKAELAHAVEVIAEKDESLAVAEIEKRLLVERSERERKGREAAERDAADVQVALVSRARRLGERRARSIARSVGAVVSVLGWGLAVATLLGWSPVALEPVAVKVPAALLVIGLTTVQFVPRWWDSTVGRWEQRMAARFEKSELDLLVGTLPPHRATRAREPEVNSGHSTV